MIKVAVLKIKLYASWVHSLKEKRMVVKSLLAKIRNKFQVSAAEVEDMLLAYLIMRLQKNSIRKRSPIYWCLMKLLLLSLNPKRCTHKTILSL